MYLTRFEINRARRGAQKLLGSPQAMHAAVLSSFPGVGPEPDAGRPLWRVDGGSNSTKLYISSAREPDLTHLVEQAGWPTTHAWVTRDYRPLLESLKPGASWGFRLVANPTRSVRNEIEASAEVDGRAGRGRRTAHVTASQQLSWFLDRAESWGIDVSGSGEDNVAVTERQTRTFRRQGSNVTIGFARFDGVLTVTDAAALRTAMTRGIGPAKAYGCGLLTLAPISPAPE